MVVRLSARPARRYETAEPGARLSREKVLALTAPVLRRGACPGLLAPMETGDGLLVRLPAGLAPLRSEALHAVGKATEECGNGIVEVTARGSIQARGFGRESARRFADALVGLGIGDVAGPAVACGPLAGLDPTEAMDVRPLAESLRPEAAKFAGRLGPKVSIVVDGGGALHLDALAADIRFCAETNAGRFVLHVFVAGDGQKSTWLGAVEPEDTAPTAAALLGLIAAEGLDGRARDILRARGVEPLREAIASWVVEAPRLALRTPAETIGTHRLRDGTVAVGVGLAFGHTDARTLRGLVALGDGFGARSYAPAPGRALLAIGMPAAAADEFRSEARRIGFIVDANDPRRSVVACAGAPACASALMPARDIAPAIADAARRLLDGSAVIHLSGCAKGCAHPGQAALTLVGDANGYGVVLDGTARSASSGHTGRVPLPGWFGELSGKVGAARRPAEPGADALRRIGFATPALEDATP